MLMLGRKPVSPLCMPYAGIEKATNCLLEVPQNIKLELSNNVLTIKARSIITLTGSTYATLTTNVDGSITLGNGSDNSFYIIMTGNPNAVTPAAIFPVKLSSSGDSNGFPTENLTNITTYYNTDDKIWYRYNPTTTLWDVISKYPLGIIERKNNIWSFAKDSNGNDMIFNGAGFIGHHAFVYPDVEALAPDGFNEDKSFKSVELTNNALRIIEMTTTTSEAGYEKILQMGNTGVYNSNNYREVESYNDLGTQNYSFQYVKKDNIIYYYNGATYETRIIVKILSYSYDGTRVTDFTIQQPLTKYRWVVKLVP